MDPGRAKAVLKLCSYLMYCCNLSDEGIEIRKYFINPGILDNPL